MFAPPFGQMALVLDESKDLPAKRKLYYYIEIPWNVKEIFSPERILPKFRENPVDKPFLC